MVDDVIPGKCGICHRGLGGRGLMMCSRCNSLYHPDCWAYNWERCAVYGCWSRHRRTAESPAAPRSAAGVLSFGVLAGLVLICWGINLFSELEPALETKYSSEVGVRFAPERRGVEGPTSALSPSDIVVQGLRWKRIPATSRDQEDLEATAARYDVWVSFSLTNESRTEDAIQIQGSLLFEEEHGNLLQASPVPLLRRDPVTSRPPGTAHVSLPRGKTLQFRFPVRAPGSAESCNLRIEEVRGEPH